MKKDDLKKLMFSGFMVGCLSVAQSGIADESEKILDETSEVAVVEDKNGEEIFAAGCGGKNGCGNKTSPQTRNVYEEEQENYQGQGQGHTCGNRSQPYQGRA